MRISIWIFAVVFAANITGCLAERTVEGEAVQEEAMPAAADESAPEPNHQGEPELAEEDQPELPDGGEGEIEPGFPGVDFPLPECQPDFPPEELCGDGLDNDCNGKVDEDCIACASDEECEAGGGGSLCYESSIVRYGVPGTCTNGVCDHVRQVIACPNGCHTDDLWGNCFDAFDHDGDGFSVATGDCDENNPLTHPEAPEICGDERDNDCNDLVDDGCEPQPEPECLHSYDGQGFRHEDMCWMSTEAWCNEDGNVHISRDTGECRDGRCINEVVIEECDFGCEDGFCVEPECRHSWDPDNLLDDSCFPVPPEIWCQDGSIHETVFTGECLEGSCVISHTVTPCELGCEGFFCNEPPPRPVTPCELDKDCRRLFVGCEDHQDDAVRFWEPDGCDEDRGLCLFNERVVSCDVSCDEQENYWDCDSAFDWDEDGFSEDEGDCSPGEYWINPDATEFCDLVDNNCNGEIDEDWGGLECVACEVGADCQALGCVFDGLDEGYLCGGYGDECWQGFCQRAWLGFAEEACILECEPDPEDPQPEPGNWEQIALGVGYNCALDTQGSPTCWWTDDWDVNTGPGEGPFMAIAAASPGIGVALDMDGHPVCWGGPGNNLDRVCPSEEVFVQISLNHAIVCGLRENGSVLCWGGGANAEYDGPFSFIEASGNTLCALDLQGGVSCRRIREERDDWGLVGAPDGTFTTVRSFADYACGITSRGSVQCWGEWIPFPDDATIRAESSLVQLAPGANFLCGLYEDGVMECWAQDERHIYQIPADARFSAIDGHNRTLCGVTTDGNLMCWGDPWVIDNMPN